MQAFRYITPWVGRSIVFVLLTAITQVGGLVYLLALLIKRNWTGWRRRLIFPVLYLLVWLLLPLLAAPLGRVPLPLWANVETPLQPQNYMMILANRHYVTPALRAEVLEVSQMMHSNDSTIILTYLDANFPFVNGFPLFPHRSHDDGEKLDLAYFYEYKGERTSRAPSLFGYGRCARPQIGEMDQPTGCEQAGFWQYNLLAKLASPFLAEGYTLDEAKTKQMVTTFARRRAIGKLFIEPHLKNRWRLDKHPKVRFHGCAAVRHDDHLHIQL